MDDREQYENRNYKMDYYKGPHPMHMQWDPMGSQHQLKEQNNALVMNKKIMSILAERDAALRERSEALYEKREAINARDEALQHRDKAIAERDDALMERDNAVAAIHYWDSPLNFSGAQKGKRLSSHQATQSAETDSYMSETIDYCPTKRGKESETSTQKAKKTASNKKTRMEFDNRNLEVNLVNYDETTMPVPVCTCTGVARQCYKWGNGGWQSSCCTITVSQHPLPQMPNKRHARIGGRKMSGTVFARVINRIVAEGHCLSDPVDLKNYWARHGTNRYLTIK